MLQRGGFVTNRVEVVTNVFCHRGNIVSPKVITRDGVNVELPDLTVSH